MSQLVGEKRVSYTFPADLESLGRVVGFVRDFCEKQKIAEKVIWQLQLAVDESVVNIIRHSYQGREGEIVLVLQLEEKELVITLIDEGPRSNPLEDAPQYDPYSPLPTRSLDGLGVFLLQEMVDGVEYRWEEGTNRLILQKRLP